MRIEVNGEGMEVEARNIGSLVAELGFQDLLCAVALNGGFVPRGEHGNTALKQSDQVEIVAPMKGG